MSSNPKISSKESSLKTTDDKYNTGSPHKKAKVSCERCTLRGMSCSVSDSDEGGLGACSNCHAVQSRCSLAGPRTRSLGLVNHGVRSAYPTEEPSDIPNIPSTQSPSTAPSTSSLKRKREPAIDPPSMIVIFSPRERQHQTEVQPPSQQKVVTKPSGHASNQISIPKGADTQTSATNFAKYTEASGTRLPEVTPTVSRPMTLPNAGDSPSHDLPPLTGSLETPMTESRAKGKERQQVEVHLPRSTLKTSLPQPPMSNITEKNPPPSTALPPTTSSVDGAAGSSPAASRSNVKSPVPRNSSSSTLLPRNATESTGNGPAALHSTKARMKESVVTCMEEVIQEKLNALIEDMVDECFLSIAQSLKETFGKP